jgi:hypothetical protein
VPEFLVEAYVARSGLGTPSPDELARAADQVTRRGRAVRLTGRIFVPQDETGLFLFEAECADDVRAAAAECGLRFERLVRAFCDWPAGRD